MGKRQSNRLLKLKMYWRIITHDSFNQYIAIGGIVVGWSMLSICWITTVAVSMAWVFVGKTHMLSKRLMTE